MKSESEESSSDFLELISGRRELLTLEYEAVLCVKLQTLFKMKVYKQNELNLSAHYR